MTFDISKAEFAEANAAFDAVLAAPTRQESDLIAWQAEGHKPANGTEAARVHRLASLAVTRILQRDYAELSEEAQSTVADTVRETVHLEDDELTRDEWAMRHLGH
jgi:hypothetical protein